MTEYVIDSANLNVTLGDSAKIEVGQAINYIKSGQAEISEVVTAGTNAFNANAAEKQASVDASAALAKQYAIGEPTEPTGKSAKYWADQAAAIVPELAPVATSGSYNDLTDKPYIGNGILTIQKNGVDVKKFSANADSDTTANITVPTNTNELTNGAGFITGINSGDVTTALGFTPYDANNPDGFISGINSADVTAALGFTPADNNLSNVSTTAKVSSCGWAMPSDSKFDNLTVAASGSNYVMTSSGYLMVNGSSTSTSDTLVVVNNTTNMQVAARGGSGSYMRVFLPVQKGASVKLNYTSGVTINQLRFIYAVGSESEAS